MLKRILMAFVGSLCGVLLAVGVLRVAAVRRCSGRCSVDCYKALRDSV